MSKNWLVYKQNEACSYNGVLLENRKEWHWCMV
jgi:hypothetical protein